MPRGLQQILKHAEELERRFSDHEPVDVRDAEPLRVPREAVSERAAAERRISAAVTAAAHGAGMSWSAIGGMLGTSGEAARKRYATRPTVVS